MYNRDNLKLRLNLVKRAVITYEQGDDTSVVIDISGDGKIRINDNGIVRDYDVEKYFTDGILHKSLGNIFIEETDGKGCPDEGEIVEWKVEFFNRKHLDHVIYGTKRRAMLTALFPSFEGEAVSTLKGFIKCGKEKSHRNSKILR